MVVMGVGQDPEVINNWVEEIWAIFDVDGNGYLDLDELNFFVGEVFRTSGLKIFYDMQDLKDLFSKQDKDDDGSVSKDEMKDFLVRLGGKKNKHPTFMDLQKYKNGGYYGGLVKAFEDVTVEKEEEGQDQTKEVFVVSKKSKKMKSKVESETKAHFSVKEQEGEGWGGEVNTSHESEIKLLNKED